MCNEDGALMERAPSNCPIPNPQICPHIRKFGSSPWPGQRDDAVDLYSKGVSVAKGCFFRSL